ncbi:hypothetical protein Agub_g6094 [Astrephomene gubernaculifera]|uniref:Translation initiation factor 3 N-terminal domain-containing protein n=1 Tax=Astrephomene gubernaculifera TaxID=47775 RepID=A0AAD3HL56_9CHLO|nr:hypothetical protein Agub_g6094 [Astrephomene gubernaculifera]
MAVTISPGTAIRATMQEGGTARAVTTTPQQQEAMLLLLRGVLGARSTAPRWILGLQVSPLLLLLPPLREASPATVALTERACLRMWPLRRPGACRMELMGRRVARTMGGYQRGYTNGGGGGGGYVNGGGGTYAWASGTGAAGAGVGALQSPDYDWTADPLYEDVLRGGTGGYYVGRDSSLGLGRRGARDSYKMAFDDEYSDEPTEVKPVVKVDSVVINGKTLQANAGITAKQVFLLGAGPERQPLGAMPTSRAQALADEAKEDLLLINPDASPPVARIVNWSKYKYELEKSAKERKAKSSK